MAAPLSNTHWENETGSRRGDGGDQRREVCRNTKMMMKAEQHLVINATNALSLSSEKPGLIHLALCKIFYLHNLLKAYSLEGFEG